MPTGKEDEVIEVDAPTEEQQIEEMVKNKGKVTPTEPDPEKIKDKPAPEVKGKKEKEEQQDDDGEEDKKPEKEAKKKELTEKQIASRISEIEEKDEKDLTEEDKAFLEEHGEKEDEIVSPDDYISSMFGEKFEVKSLKDLNEFMETAVAISEERDQLKEELEEAKKKGPTYKSDGQKKAAEFLEKIGYEPDKYSEGLMTYGQVMTMDLSDKDLNGKLVLEAQFLVDHPELTRDEARRKFEKTYTKKYELNRDDFDSEEDFKDAEEDARIERKTAVAKAVKALQKTQEEFKSQSKPDKKDEKPEIAPEVEKGIEKTSSALTEHLDKNDQLIFSFNDDPEDDFHYQFDDAQLDGIRKGCLNVLQNPTSYDKKGNLLTGNIEDLSRRMARFLYGDDIDEKLYEHALTVTSAKRLEEVADRKPDRKPKGTAGASDIDIPEEKQIEIMIQKKKDAQAKKRPAMA